jgi:hypothetical protein
MKRTRIATVSLPLVLLTLTTLIQYVGSAKATDLYNIDWGHMKRYQPDQTEMYFEANTAFAVKCMFSNRQGWSSWYAYDDLTTAANLFDTIDYRQQNDVWASDFWVGDFFGNYTEGNNWR